MFDLLEELAAIHRSVVRDGRSETVSVALTRTYDADLEDVWDALTNAERLPRWFSPVTGDLEPGGSYQIENNAGGDILRCDPPTQLQVTFGSPDSIVDVRLAHTDGHTTVELTHTVALALAGSGAGALHVGPGWDGALLALGTDLDGTPPDDPVAFANSPEVVEFNRGSIDRWTTTIETSGTATPQEVADAREAAVANYTVVPD
ncbi:SRPBCC family protein [Actinotalea sp. K2]|uniref:SRPBCC family protein n=1 Tax=Actinotalea sp. K2 TaxID=2939438 RepID=UPI0020171555|nr:SRPBCC family protein [Actinotalea sp. K2]MCL3862482.1 SRPBCC family protein [Actinotalea sp. K2]